MNEAESLSYTKWECKYRQILSLFSGFGPEAISTRLRDVQAKICSYGSGGFRRRRLVSLEPTLDLTLQQVPIVRLVIAGMIGDAIATSADRDIGGATSFTRAVSAYWTPRKQKTSYDDSHIGNYRFCEGPLEIVAILTLLLVPFLDRGVAKRLAQRTVAFGAVALAAIGWTGLTVTAIVTTPRPTTGSAESLTVVQGWQQLSPEALAGIGYYHKEQCGSCHNLTDVKTKVGPNLSTTPIKRSGMDGGALQKSCTDGSRNLNATDSFERCSAICAGCFLLTLTPSNAKDLESAPDKVLEGAMIYQQQQRGMCEIVNGVGVQLVPALNGVADRRRKEWIEIQIRSPKRHSAATALVTWMRSIEYLTAIPPR